MNPIILDQGMLEAAGDAVARALGVRSADQHPLADGLAIRPFSSIARFAARARAPQRAGEDDRALLARGMSTSDFAAALANGAQQLAIKRFHALAAHRKFCGRIKCKNFNAEPIPRTEISVDLAQLSEFAEIVGRRVVLEAGGQARLMSFATRLDFSRHVLINDETGVISAGLSSLATAAARLESRLVYAALEANEALDDGAPVFHADHGNVIAQEFSETSLGLAIAALRRQPRANGEQADIAAVHLIVSPESELAAQKINVQSGLGLVVTGSADVPSGRWFVLGDPESHPLVAFLELAGSQTSLRIDPPGSRRGDDFDGVPLRAIADLGAAIVGRIGGVRGGV